MIIFALKYIEDVIILISNIIKYWRKISKYAILFTNYINIIYEFYYINLPNKSYLKFFKYWLRD